MTIDEQREKLAEYAHEAWSDWMRYMFSKGKVIEGRIDEGGAVLLPAWAVDRWQRQMNTPYADLSEKEKELDRAEADKILAIINTGKQ